jgi:hypothetical protein
MPGASSIDLHVSNKSQIAKQALDCISKLYDVEREIKHLTAVNGDTSGKPDPNHWLMHCSSG